MNVTYTKFQSFLKNNYDKYTENNRNIHFVRKLKNQTFNKLKVLSIHIYDFQFY